MAELLRFDAPAISFQAAQADEDPNKGIRCTLVGYSGGEMNVAGFGQIVVDVSGVKADAQTPLLSDHDSSLDGLIGYATVSAADNKITASGIIVPQTAAAQAIVGLAKAGFQFQASIGLEPETQEQIKPDTLVSVNGRQIRSGPRGLTLVRAGTLKEISVLPLGADSTTSVNVAARNQGIGQMPTTTVTDSQEIIRAERERVAAVEQAVSPFLAGDASGQVAGFRAKALAGELDLPALNASLLGVLRTSRAELQRHRFLRFVRAPQQPGRHPQRRHFDSRWRGTCRRPRIRRRHHAARPRFEISVAVGCSPRSLGHGRPRAAARCP